jgi:hypothetical protein
VNGQGLPPSSLGAAAAADAAVVVEQLEPRFGVGLDGAVVPLHDAVIERVGWQDDERGVEVAERVGAGGGGGVGVVVVVVSWDERGARRGGRRSRRGDRSGSLEGRWMGCPTKDCPAFANHLDIPRFHH